MAKINISMDDDLLAKVEKLADEMYMSKSGFISHACTQLVMQNLMVSAVTDLSVAMMKIAETNEIDDKSRQELEDIERLVRMLTGQRK